MGWGALLSILAPAVPGLINVAEAAITAPKAGQSRGAAVLAALRGIIAGMIATKHPATTPPVGSPAGSQPDDSVLQGMIETIFQQMAADKTLSAKAPFVSAPESIFILRGGTILKVPEVQ